MLTYAYASRVLLPQGIGQIDFAKAITTFLTMIALLGMRHYGTRECAKVKDNKIKLNKTLKELLTLNLITTLFAYLALALLLIFSNKLGDYREIILIYSLQAGLTVIGVE